MIGKRIVIDAIGHVAGKLAGHIAKELMCGIEVVIVHAENVMFTGPIKRGVGKFNSHLNKSCSYNPLRGPFHLRSPSMHLMKVIKRKLPHRKSKGQIALKRLQVFDGCPTEYLSVEKMVCPRDKLEYTTSPIRKSYKLGDLMIKFGWKYESVVEKMNQNEEQFKIEETEKQKVKEQKIEELKKSNKFQQRVEEIMVQMA
ncbi:Ribosomal protein L13A [Spraguea lophii 42_110]|uniref:Ribosomal protein L13A n=1 Tax=Spraguea lophii (strain 42_110) TaxID=1358809 RepID=S7XUD8_SPRLO|nr:Chain LO0, Ribosomal protein L13A [Spraguea lophii 42_110]7QJH_KO0 Chain KO0, Ribosomal protein L13A [Spraguea lophii 42_110]7QJH_LO0 Chain LO0, Ribosomal protein L13A [Spraguea lophii 42_110]8BR3_LO0 Chain LO0, Ribosomal protein L13A [Spraguea lophii 42_110]8P5D_LO0 Chain LO0, Ribosomal protein L13A [Spraguea lophii 42_110]8P60_KO0 Chain KO0, Ribosomal protein L13A [Spraguea lophii 42_110]8P60_LO0 Chain LO0, Ribosomal protein L13A [Spraguea lophii 42_110]EPR79528.1 Ribosomal protein L13A